MMFALLRRAPGAALFIASLAVVLAAPARAQFETRWLAAGDLHDWYSSAGSECEVCLVNEQQYGFRWPGIYQYTDTQAATGMWLGALDVTDASGSSFPFRVVHSGPRVRGVGEIFPTVFELVSRYELPVVTVDGDQSFASAEMVADRVDPSIPSDVMINSEFNTLLGITVQRRVYQFSQQYHDDYHVEEYIFTNTGNTDADPEIELPNRTVEGFVAFFQARMAVSREGRYVVDNSTGWGKNAMIDTRGDGLVDDPADEQFRAQFVWHGKSTVTALPYDNLGASAQAPVLNIAASDTLGRLTASQFVGVVTLHADVSPSNDADDPAQPSTTTWVHSDDKVTSNNDAFNAPKMASEYALMTSGHKARHATTVEPSGLPGFLDPTNDPSLGESGGYSYGNGYGPYTLAPGESVRIVVAQAANGLSREANMAIGKAFKASGNDADAKIVYMGESKTKNEWIFTGRDSLFQTFRRALANFESGYDIPLGPLPPHTLDIRSGGDRISLNWTTYADAPPFTGWEVYRAQADYDSTYTLVHTAGVSELSFDDTTPIRGIDYYYYVVAVQDGASNLGGGMTPAGVPLRSSRYASQSYAPARLQRPQGEQMQDIRVVPNPFYMGASRDIRFPDRNDKLAFFNIPGFCRIDIYTEIGELVDSIEHSDGSGDEFWDHTTSSRQIVASGLYIAVITVTQDITDPSTGVLLYRAGEQAMRKFVIIR